MDSTPEATDTDDTVPLGSFLYQTFPDAEIDSVEAVRELREHK